MSAILEYSKNSTQTCATLLQRGGLVAFPTETVYGLGANVLNSYAIEKIFRAKGRPKTDPLIVHISDIEQAWSLVSLNPIEKQITEILAKEFWPGPLTLILRASGVIPDNVNAGKGTVGLRIPDHPVALELLKYAGVPVAAPSANRFAHVSPTSARHVQDDLTDPDITILDGGDCAIGIESTVLKMIDEKNLILLRRGFISPVNINSVLLKSGLNVHIQENRIEEKSIDICQDSPGQNLTHYAPNLPAFVIKNSISTNAISMDKNSELKFVNVEKILELTRTVIIDFQQRYLWARHTCFAYFDLSPNGDEQSAAAHFFSSLRWAENIDGADKILLPDFSKSEIPLLAALYDRVHRATSGKVLYVNSK